MNTTGLEVFDATVQKTNTWLNELMLLVDFRGKRQAYEGLRATLHALRDRLTVEETAHLSAQLPMLIRGLFYEQWDPTGKPLKIRHLDEFLDAVRRPLPADYPCEPEDVARAVFSLLASRIADGEVEDVKHLLPAALRTLWP